MGEEGKEDAGGDRRAELGAEHIPKSPHDLHASEALAEWLLTLYTPPSLLKRLYNAQAAMRHSGKDNPREPSTMHQVFDISRAPHSL